MTSQRKGYRNPIPTTDLIIEYHHGKKAGIVLSERKNQPYGIALPGGFHELNLSAEENAIKEAREETGLDVVIEEPERPLCYHTSPTRDPRYHIISATFIAKGKGILKAGDDAAQATLYSIDEVVDLLEHGTWAFHDHTRALRCYLRHRGYQ